MLNQKDKNKVLCLFKKNVLGKYPNTEGSNEHHDGKAGHWLEKQMGIARNGKNAPDLFGFEMKNQTTSKTTFGDWSASYYIFKDDRYACFSGKMANRRFQFLSIFGKPNLEKKGRLSWSGEPIPKINQWNTFGCILRVDTLDNILIEYSYSKDQRLNKSEIVPLQLQQEDLTIASWSSDLMKSKVEKKFNQNGWFKCLQDKNGRYCAIIFGAPMTFGVWIDLVRNGTAFFDSGMYDGNSRPYSQWRATNLTWDKLVIQRYDETDFLNIVCHC